ncbi:hypothetical protein HZA56_21850 [Candidatus Poribacteria bacterium]|nr:hypothetical protein [Candidatus Poribacteria bacterium]
MKAQEERIRPVAPGEASDEDINAILRDTQVGWWRDSRMFGVIAHVPEALRGWVHLITGTATAVDPVTWELMALRGAFVTGCHY